jgi:hypothetical protein
MVVPMTPSEAVSMSNPDGQRYCCPFFLCSSQFCRKNRPLLSQQFIVGEIKFFPVVVDTVQPTKKSKFSPVSTIAGKLFIDFIDTSDKFFAGVSAADNTILPIDLKMKNKQNFNL